MIYDIQIKTDQRTLVDIEDFELNPGKLTLLLGESGIGKTLISRAIFGLLPDAEMSITINKRSYAEYLASDECHEIQSRGFFVFQEPSSHLNPLMTLSEQLNEGVIEDASSNRKILKDLFPALSESDLYHLLGIYPKPYRPSGGEKQRILIAMAFKKMALLRGSDAVFIFDEPTGNLDNVYRNIFLRMLIAAYKSVPLTTLLITHDYSMISELLATPSGDMKQIEFKELRISDNHQKQVAFSTESYLNWLKSLNPASPSIQSSREPVLMLQPEIEVFNRKLIISSDIKGRDVSPLEIFAGDAVYLKAASGVGKTTVAKIIMGLQPAERFSMILDNRTHDESTPGSVWRRNIWAKRMSMVFQHADEALNLNGKVKDIFRGLPLSQRSDPDFLKRTLATVFDRHIAATFLEMPVAFLSGGQKQRLNLIRALILEPDILILDEPFNGLDFNTMQRILNLLQELQKKGKSFLIISHNEEIIDRFVSSERIYYLHRQTDIKGET